MLDGIYVCKLLYYDSGDRAWATLEKEWLLDASGVDLKLEKGDRLVAYYDAQRGMLVPCWRCDRPTVLDANDVGATAVVIHSTGEGGSDINFALEMSQDGFTWNAINGRICKVNGNVMLNDEYGSDGVAHASGSIHYTFRAQGIVLLRVRAETDVDTIEGEGVEISVERASLRVRSHAGGAIAHTLGPNLSSYATVVPGWFAEAQAGG